MGWSERSAYLLARFESKQVELYSMDLIWKLVKRYYDGDFPMPSEMWQRKNKVDRRSAEQIIADTLKGLGGE